MNEVKAEISEHFLKSTWIPSWGIACVTHCLFTGLFCAKLSHLFLRCILCSKGNTMHGLLLLLSHFSRVQLCATPDMAAHQAPPSPGFSRQEHWSGLPFPSPTQESEK